MASEHESSSFGWELLYSLYERNFSSKLNLIVAWTHFNLIKNGFKNAGMGEDTTLPAQRDLKETLPVGWHDQMPCRMRYFYDKKLYLLTILHGEEDEDVIINLNRICDKKTTVATVNMNDVEKLNGTLEEIIPDWHTKMRRLTEDLINPLVKDQASKDIHVQTEPLEGGISEEFPRIYSRPSYIPPMPPRIARPPGAGIGSSDLDPLGGGGGGMLFQPPGIGPRPFMPDPFLPPGSVPPGARYDPIMPGRGGAPRPQPRRSFPDPDHLPPPGYDDMFS